MTDYDHLGGLEGRGHANVRYSSDICLEGLRKAHRTSVTVAGLRTEILAQDLPYKKQGMLTTRS
jgi:hypothetical protein